MASIDHTASRLLKSILDYPLQCPIERCPQLSGFRYISSRRGMRSKLTSGRIIVLPLGTYLHVRLLTQHLSSAIMLTRWE